MFFTKSTSPIMPIARRYGRPATMPGAFSQMQRKLLGKPLSLLHHHDEQERR
jgi:hypothetical protein